MANDSKIPIRGITKMLTNLDPGVRAKLENAFIEAESQLDYHNQSAVDRNDKRKPNGKVGAPIVTVTTNTLGFDLNWPKLKDRVITMYEVQISTQSNFSSIISYNTVDNFFQVEGAASVTYVRVRGVRWNGECGPWSHTVIVSVAAVASGPVVYSKTIADLNHFYRNFPAKAYPSPITDMTIVPQRDNGGVVFFGSFGVEFYVDATGFRGHRGNHFYLGTETSVDDSLMVTVNGQRVQNLTYLPCFQSPGWSNLQSPPQSTVFGYSLGFGPGFLAHSQFYKEEFGYVFPNSASERSDKVVSFDGGAGGTYSHHIGWATKKNLLNLYDERTGAINDGSSTYLMHVDFAILAAQEITKTLVTSNYKFAIPSTSIIKGIEAKIIATPSAVHTVTFNRIRLINSNGVPRSTTKGSGDAWATTTYGGPNDLWGESAGFWTPDKLNSQYFGLDLQGKLVYDYDGVVEEDNIINAYGVHLTVYTDMGGPEQANIRIQYKPRTNDFYSYPYTRSILKNCTLNALEFGTKVRS